MRAFVVLGMVMIGLTFGCSSEVEPPPMDRDTTFDALDDKVAAYLADNELSGATMVIVHEDEGVVHMRGFGAFDPDRIMLIASSSKVLSVGVLLRLAEQGMIDIDEPIADYLGEWGMHRPGMTVAQLLSNSSGLVGLVDDPLYGPYLCQYLESGSLSDCAEAIFSAEDAADIVPPDTQFRYGGGQWQLAGGVAEAVSGKTWAELIAETYVEPCGLANTAYSNHFQKAATSGGTAGAFSYPAFFTGDVNDLPSTDNPNIEGGAYTTIGDYAEILMMHLRGGLCGDQRVLSEASVERMQQDRILDVYGGTTTLDPTMQGYGLGWWISRDEPVISDAGAYGATPWLDLDRRYGAMFIIEGEATQGALLRVEVQPMLEEIFDAR